MQIQSLAPTVKPTDSSATDIRPKALEGKLNSSADNASARAQQHANLNSAVMQSALDVSIGAKNEPQALLFRSVIESLNEVLAEDFGENAIQNAMSQDNSAEATAERIVSMSTAFFDAFKQQHAGEDDAAVLEKFMDTIRSGFESGFGEAQSILDGLGVLEGDIADGINQTYELVLQGYADFVEAQSAANDSDEASIA